MVLSAGAEQNTQHSGKCQSWRNNKLRWTSQCAWVVSWANAGKNEARKRDTDTHLSLISFHTLRSTHTQRDLYIYMSCLSPSERVFTRAFLTSQSRRVLIISYHAPRRSACSSSAALSANKKFGTSLAPRVRKSPGCFAMDVCCEGGVVLNFVVLKMRLCRSWGIWNVSPSS